MTIDAATATGGASMHATTTPSTDAKKTMDQEVFLALLVAQLRNQDPTSPMDTTEMMSQSTQLASMEALNGMADTSREAFSLQMRIAATAMVGQTVSYVDADGATVTGTASAVSFADSTPTVLVDGVQVPLDLVAAVSARTPSAPEGDAGPDQQDQPTDPTPDPTDSAAAAGGDTTAA